MVALLFFHDAIAEKRNVTLQEQLEKIKEWIEENRLIKLTYIVEKLGEQVIYGRIVKLDAESKIVLVYVVDEKKVESIRMHAIEVIEPSDYSGDQSA